MLDITRQVKNKICAVEALTETTEESIDDCAVPLFYKKSLEFDIPVYTNPAFLPLLDKRKGLFRTFPGSTTQAKHFISTTGTPVQMDQNEDK